MHFTGLALDQCTTTHVIMHNMYNKEYIIIEKRVSNVRIPSVECVRKVTRLECKFINDHFHIICDSIRTEFRVYEHNQACIRRLFAFQARDFPHTFNGTYRDVQYSLLPLLQCIYFWYNVYMLVIQLHHAGHAITCRLTLHNRRAYM